MENEEVVAGLIIIPNGRAEGIFFYHLKNVSYSKCVRIYTFIYIEHVAEILLMDSLGGQFNNLPELRIILRREDLCNFYF